jgi:hypothetical protein
MIIEYCVQGNQACSLAQDRALHSDNVARGVRAAAVVPAQVAQHPSDGGRREARAPHRHQLTHLLHLSRKRQTLCLHGYRRAAGTKSTLCC